MEEFVKLYHARKSTTLITETMRKTASWNGNGE
jgi:hypothetical protein